MSGWYPDPGREPDRYRYWDGAHWSAETAPDPSRPAPTGVPTTRRRVPATLVVGAAAAVVGVLLLVGWLRPPGTGRASTDEPLPSSSVSGWDDSSPPPRRPTTSPTPSPGPTGDGLCVSGRPNARDYAPADGRVHGGGLSFPAAAELDPAENEPRFSFAHDVSQQTKGVHDRPGWIAQLAVGRLRADDGFDDGARRVAEQVLRCTVTSTMYEPYRPARVDLRAAATVVDGVRGWSIEADVTVQVAGLPFPGDRVLLVVLTDGGGDYSFFFSATPIGDRALAAVAARARSGLRVD